MRYLAEHGQAPVIDGEVHFDFDFTDSAPPDDGKTSLGTGTGSGPSVRVTPDQAKALDGARIVGTALSGAAGAVKAALGRLFRGVASRATGALSSTLGRITGNLAKGVDTAHDASKAAGGVGRGGTKLKPDPSAQGPHTTFKRDPQTGKVTGHAGWDAQGNPVKRTDITGAAHGPVKTPHTHEYGPPNVDPASGKSYPGKQVKVRPATPDEIPR
jgi:hypothetical protein